MQDSAPIHTAYKVRDWFLEHGIPVTDWPPYSPDLNPIEHVWRKLKELVLEMHLEISDITGEENIREALGKALQEAWDAIPKEYFDRLREYASKGKSSYQSEGLAYQVLNIRNILM